MGANDAVRDRVRAVHGLPGLSSVPHREEYDATGDNAGAVAHGLATTARVISAAAAIMVAVFSSFVLLPELEIKVFGLGLAVAVFVDATIVRLLLVPATMEVLGDRNWWIPKWMDRVLPRVETESRLKSERVSVAS
jgi:putative drug exporter of the RND superfamily